MSGDHDDEGGGGMTDLESLWVFETGTPPPAFGEDSPWDHLDELRRMSWADSFAWAERIKGSALLPGQVRKLQKAHGFNCWGHAAKKTAVRRRNGNGENDPDGSAPPTQRSWASVNGWNPHNRRVAGEARRLRYRVFLYCLTSQRRALKSGAAFVFPEVFRAACARVFGRPAPYANRSRVKAFRDWVEATLSAKNVTHPPGRALNSGAPAMFYASPRLEGDFRSMTHRPGGSDTSGQDSEGSGECDGIPVFGRAGAGGPLNPEGRCPSRLEPGPTPCSIKAGARATCLVGVARSALPTLLQAHLDVGEGRRRILWDAPLPCGAPTQERWAFGWLAAWIRKGRSARRLTEIYAAAVRDFERRYQDAGYTPGECPPWALRGHLQRRARELPSYGPEHFRERPSVFQPTASQRELAKWRRERREEIAEFRRREREARRRERLCAKEGRHHANAPEKARREVAADAVTSAWEDEMADFNAEMAGAEMDRRNARRPVISERDQWARDLGNEY